MAEVEIRVPEIGESVNEVTLSAWLKQDGDYVEMDEEIAEFESDKATLEFPSPEAGKLIIVAEEGEDLKVGDLVCKIDTSASKSSDSESSSTTEEKSESKEEDESKQEETTKEADQEGDMDVQEPEPKGKPGKVEDAVVPEIGESINEVTLVDWLVEDGDIVELDQEIAEFDSDKATLEFPSPFAGKIEFVANVGDDLEIGAVVAKIDTGFAGASSSTKSAAKEDKTPTKAEQQPNKQEKKEESKSTKETYATGHASPAAAKKMKEEGVKASQLSGSGPDGRITKEDVVNFLKNGGVADAEQVVAALEQTGGSREQSREKMSRMRRTISRRLVEVKNETAMLTTFNDVNMEAIMSIREQYKKSFEEEHGIRLGFMSFFTRACAIALMKFPAVNGYIDGEEIIYNNYADISIAVSTPKGLVVPVMRNTEAMSMAGIEKKVRELALKGRDGKLTMDEMTGGTFTITNGGIFGSLLSTPIINAPQSAILGMHRIEERPIVIDGQVVVKPMMYLALSYDHRIIDGKESVTFLKTVKELLENPERMLLGENPIDVLLGMKG